MNEDTAARQESPGRTFAADVTGDTADEIELAVLDEARAFFGQDVRLEVTRDYFVSPVRRLGIGADSGKKYWSHVIVHVVEG